MRTKWRLVRTLGVFGRRPRGRATCGLLAKALYPGQAAIRTAIIAPTVLVLTGAIVLAQEPSVRSDAVRPLTGMGSKSLESCTTDKRKFCTTTASDSILKECLVKNWNYISSDCQDALGMQIDRIHPDIRR